MENLAKIIAFATALVVAALWISLIRVSAGDSGAMVSVAINAAALTFIIRVFWMSRF